jgi:hypothetical protein
MIIRRQHTANFTTIGNALFEDERLAADEVGILAFLLSRPHDWEVRRPAIMRRWHIGPVALKRIVDNWMRTGWCLTQKKRLDNGTFEIIYEIRDEPGPSLSEDEIRRALSLVSGEVATEESDGQTPAERVPEDPQPPPCQPGVAGPVVADQGVVSLLKKDSTKGEREGACGYDRKAKFLALFEARWPTSVTDDRFHTAKACRELPDDEEEPALKFIGPFLEKLKAAGRKHIPAGWKYLEGKPWTLASEAKTTETHSTHFAENSPEAKALAVLYAIAGKSGYFNTVLKSSHGGIWYRGEITPRLLALAQAPAQSVWRELDYRQAASWDGLLADLVTVQTRGHLKAGSRAPWPWPPKSDGSIYTEDSTGPPNRVEGTLASEDDLNEFAKG